MKKSQQSHSHSPLDPEINSNSSCFRAHPVGSHCRHATNLHPLAAMQQQQRQMNGQIKGRCDSDKCTRIVVVHRRLVVKKSHNHFNSANQRTRAMKRENTRTVIVWEIGHHYHIQCGSWLILLLLLLLLLSGVCNIISTIITIGSCTQLSWVSSSIPQLKEVLSTLPSLHR